MAWFRGLVHSNFQLSTGSYRKLAVVSLKHVRNYVYHFLLRNEFCLTRKVDVLKGEIVIQIMGSCHNILKVFFHRILPLDRKSTWAFLLGCHVNGK